MVFQRVEAVSWENLEEYCYDDIKIEISFTNFEEIQENFFINGRKLRDFLLKKSKRIEITPNKLIINLKNCFGVIKFSHKNIEKIVRVVPSKIFQDLSPKKAYFFIKNKVLSDIGNFLSLVVKDYNDLKLIEDFEIVSKNFIKTVDYLLIFLEKIIFSIDIILKKLFFSGPIHKEILVKKSLLGTRVSFSPKNIPEPYKCYYKQIHSSDTVLNKMLFQTLYFVIRACIYIKWITRRKEFLKRIDNICRKAHFLLDKYQLWYFFDDKPLNFSEISSKLLNQSNIYYRNVFEIYRDVVKIVFSKTILTNIEEKIEFPIINFERVYELWAVSLLFNYLSKNYRFSKVSFEAYKKRKVKMKIEFFNKSSKKSFLIYEIKFNPSLDSLYFEKLVSDMDYFKIKPDVFIILEEKNRRKIFLGDIKFSKDPKLELPKLRDVYKILGYLVDLSNKSKILENSEIEGVLIFPGFIRSMKIPHYYSFRRKDKFFYINILPLNYRNNRIDIEIIQRKD